ncbi:hypothetical protein [Limimaricola sp. AA108-03]|uniref:hypothetical protein n=1 Tax=Limimaricola sp. AA108-03 TaxID=3425945 RepID=UPI003D780448
MLFAAELPDRRFGGHDPDPACRHRLAMDRRIFSRLGHFARYRYDPALQKFMQVSGCLEAALLLSVTRRSGFTFGEARCDDIAMKEAGMMLDRKATSVPTAGPFRL